eukprot:Clim_evm10s162 gene=Clim_evmTU10s162
MPVGTGHPSFLHMGIKVGQFQKTLHFFTNVLGMFVLKHGEMDSGCSYYCNGPYPNPWSKSMIGYGSESRGMVLEVAFNYTIEEYNLGNILKYIEIAEADITLRAKARGWPLKADEKGYRYLESPDGHRFRLNPGVYQHALMGLTFNCDDLQRTKEYYTSVLGMEVKSETEGKSVTLAFPGEDIALNFEKATEPIAFEDSHYRMAMSIPSSTYDSYIEKHEAFGLGCNFEKGRVGPVMVYIALDPTGNEICFADDSDYSKNGIPIAVGDGVVDWQLRAKKRGDDKELNVI